ncbi:MAG: SsrA-binding protein SmpB [Deinococcales bacterium]
MKRRHSDISIQNRRARFDYELIEQYEAGISLRGSEVKALRQGGGTIAEAFARFKHGELYLEGMHIPIYEEASYNNHDPLRSRKLLLNKSELRELAKGVERQGLTIIATKLYFKEGWAKLQIALAKGRKNYDKRQEAAKKEAKKQMEGWK